MDVLGLQNSSEVTAMSIVRSNREVTDDEVTDARGTTPTRTVASEDPQEVTDEVSVTSAWSPVHTGCAKTRCVNASHCKAARLRP